MSDNNNNLEKELMKVEFELTRIKEAQIEKDKAFESIREALYEPDKGLYRRVNVATEQVEEQHKMIRILEKKVATKHDTFDNRIRNVEDVNKVIVEITGPNLEGLRAVTEKKKKTDKLWWAMATAAIGGFAKLVWDIISHLF